MRPRPNRTPRWRLQAAAAALAALTLVGASCGDDDGYAGVEGDTDPGLAQPSRDGSEFTSGEFDDLPLFPGSEAIGTRTEDDGGVQSQSFDVDDVSPQQVIDFYEENLTGWTMDGPVDAGDALRAEFTDDDGTRLEVSSLVLDVDGRISSVQYSLILYPA